MEITVISAYFYPEITPRSFRTTELVKELINRGHKVTLYVPKRDFDYTDFKKQYPVEIKYFSNNQMGCTKLPKGNSIIKKGYRFLYYQLCHYAEYPQIKYVKEIGRTLKGTKHNVIISIAAPHCIHWGVAKAIKKAPTLCNRWIADCGDPFMGDQTIKRPFYFKGKEKLFCKLADYITVPIENAIDAYYPEFREKIRVIPQGFDFSKRGTTKVNNSVPTFAYAGILYKGYRDLNSIVDHLSKHYANKPYKFVLYTKASSLTDSYKAVLGDKLEIRDFIPREELLNVLSGMDFLLNIENAGKAQSPSKLIDYYLAARPILSVSKEINDGVVAEFMNGEYKNALCLENMERYDIVNVVDEFTKLF